MNQAKTVHTGDGRLARVIDQILSKIAKGESVDFGAYAQDHPELADILKHALPASRALATSGTQCGGTAGSIGENASQSTEKVLGDFRIIRELGHGGMGIVYEAEQLSLNRRVALKILPMAGALQKRSLQRFYNEVRAAAMLDHPHIVSVYSVGEDRGVHHYSMQLIRGQSLAEVIHELSKLERGEQSLKGNSISKIVSSVGRSTQCDGELTPKSFDPSVEDDEGSETTAHWLRRRRNASPQSGIDAEYFRSVARLGVDAALALQHAHQQGVLHRDIKPNNLMLDRDAKLYITDFGLARIESETGLTMTGGLVGTLRYMSPEQVLAKHQVTDHRSDIYSLGLTLYELLALRPAFDSNNRQQLLRQIALEEPEKPRVIRPAIPRELETIVLKAAEKDPADRYPTAQALADDLQRFLNNEPIRAKAPNVLSRSYKWCVRHPAVIWSSLLTLLLLLAASVVSSVLILQEKVRTTEALSNVKQAEQAEKRARLIADARANDARAEADRADANLKLAMQAVDEMYSEMATSELRSTPKMQQLRKKVLEQALEFYVQFANANTSPELEYETAVAWRRVGEIRHRYEENIAAMQAMDDSIAILDDLVQRFPEDNAQFRAQLASTLSYSSKPLEVMREFEQGEQRCKRAIEIQRELVMVDRSTANREALAFSLHQLGHLIQDSRQAMGCLEESSEIYEGLIEDDAQNESYIRQLAHNFDHLARCHEAQGDLELAEQRYRRAIELIETAKAQTNADVIDSYHMILAALYRNWGELQLETGRFDQSVESHRLSVSLVSALANDFPDVVYYQYQLGLSKTELGKSLAALGQFSEARNNYNDALSSFLALAKAHPENPSYDAASQRTRDLLQALPVGGDRPSPK